jgi:hypothetical protein
VIFTASIRRYADAVIDLIDVHRVVQRRYYRNACVKQGASFLKDLRAISTTPSDLRRTILIDNSPVAYTLQQENALPIATWMADTSDTALRDLIPFLLALRACDDVRPLLYRRHLLGRMLDLPMSPAERGGGGAAAGGGGGLEDVAQIPVTSAIIEQDEMGGRNVKEDEEDDDEEEHGPSAAPFARKR